MAGTLRHQKGAWRLTYQADGARHYRTHPGPDTPKGRRDAERALAALVAEVDTRRLVGDQGSTVAHLLDAWLTHAARDLEVRTLRGYEGHARLHLAPHLGPIRLNRLRPHHIDACYDALLDGGLAPKTVRNAHGTLHAALAQAVRWGWIARNPADSADPPTAKRPSLSVPTPGQVRALIAAARPDFATYLRLAATTGHRRGTLLALRWTDLDLEAGEATFARAVVDAGGGRLVEKGTKADRTDRATLDPATADALRAHRTRMAERALAAGVALGDRGHVFSQDPAGERPWHPSGVNVRWRTTCRAAGVTGVRPHDLRHFAVTELLTAGIPPHVVGQRVGLSTATMLRVYAHHIPRSDQAAAEMMGELLG